MRRQIRPLNKKDVWWAVLLYVNSPLTLFLKFGGIYRQWGECNWLCCWWSGGCCGNCCPCGDGGQIESRPAAYAAEQGTAGYERYFEGNEENHYIWTENSVRSILRSPIYAGNLAGYKRIAANMKSKKRPDIIDCVQYTCNNYGRYGNVMCTTHAIEARLKEVTETLNETYEKSQGIRDFLSLIRNYQGLKELDATVANALVDAFMDAIPSLLKSKLQAA